MSTNITVNSVITALSVALDAKYPDAPIATELIEEGLTGPYFYIRVLQPTHDRELHKRFRKTFPLVVHYFDDNRSNLDMYDMADELFSVLQEPKLDDRQIYARDMSFQIVDGVLLFFVTYELITFEQEVNEKIQTADLEVKVKYEQQ